MYGKQKRQKGNQPDSGLKPDKGRNKEREIMNYTGKVTLTFHFDLEAVEKAGLTTDELLQDMRNYAGECKITETSYGVFEKNGIDAMAMLVGYAVRKSKADPEFLDYLTSWIANIDGTIEDCKVSALKIREEKMRGETKKY